MHKGSVVTERRQRGISLKRAKIIKIKIEPYVVGIHIIYNIIPEKKARII